MVAMSPRRDKPISDVAVLLLMRRRDDQTPDEAGAVKAFLSAGIEIKVDCSLALRAPRAVGARGTGVCPARESRCRVVGEGLAVLV
jgi:hypothetical protein